MAWYHELRAALSAILHPRRQRAELDEEMRFHLDMEAMHREGHGVPPATARRDAVRAFGGVARHRDDADDERGSRSWDQLWRDVALSTRSLGHRRAFSTLVILALALGIGATTTLTGVVNAVLLKPLPYGDPDRIAVLWSAWKGFDQTWLSWDEYEAWDAESRVFSDVGLFSDGSLTLTDGDAPDRIRFAQISASVLPILGVTPVTGRNFLEEEDRPNGPKVVILSHELWEGRYGADRALVGRTIQVNGEATVVVGVMPPGFRLPLDFGSDGPTLAWTPLATDATAEGATPGPAFNPGGGSHQFFGVARLAPGVTVGDANRALATKVGELRTAGIYPESMQFRAFAVLVREQITGRVRPVLLVSLGASALLLLIACANVAALLLVRGEQRRRELAVRVALGAGPARLTRLLLVESGVLAAAGGALGILLAQVGVGATRRYAPASFPRMAETALDPFVLVVSLGVTVCVALLAGWLPALQAARVMPSADLREGGRGTTRGGARLRWRQALVTAEVALAVVIVVGAGLMVRTVRNLLAIDRGFDGRGVLTMQIGTPSTWYADSASVAGFWRDLTASVARVPGVQAVGAVRQLPLGSEMGDWGLRVEGYVPPPNSETPGDWQVVTPGYFETMGLRLVEGRFLGPQDDLSGPLAMVVNRTFVRQYLSGRTPLGVRVRISSGQPDAPWYTVVGVVDDVQHNGLTRAVKPQFYATLAHFALAPGNTRRAMRLVVRGAGDPMALAAPIRAIVREIDPRLPVSDVQAMDTVIDGAIAAQRFALQLLGAFGLLALGLAAIGVFGVVSQVVEERSREFGIRTALGATPGEVVRLSLGAGVREALVGLAVGIAAALGATRALTSLLHGVSSADLPTFVTVGGVVLAAALGASVLPAWRAARASPARVLGDG